MLIMAGFCSVFDEWCVILAVLISICFEGIPWLSDLFVVCGANLFLSLSALLTYISLDLLEDKRHSLNIPNNLK